MEAVCEQCAGSKPVAFCRQCAEFICCDCVRCHQKLKVFAHHVVASLDDPKEESTPLKETPLPTCPEHSQVIIIFCFDCDQLICRDCTLTVHSGHNFNFLKKCSPKSRKTLRDSLAPLQKVQADIAGAERTVDAEEAKVDTQKKEVCKSIEQSFDKLKALLEQQKVELVMKASTLSQEKKNALTAQKKEFQVALTKIQNLVGLAEQSIKQMSDQDLMCIHTQLHTKIEEEEKRHRLLSLEPRAIADIACNPPSPNAIYKNFSAVFNQPTPALWNTDEACELGTPAQVYLVAPTAMLVDISASLKGVANPSSSLQGDVVQKGVGIYSITYTPQVRGRHHLIVKVKEKEIAGSPFQLFVKIPPTQLRQPVRTIVGFNRPWGITINSKQQLVVAECGGKKITIMELDGRKVRTIECAKFQNPCGVASGPDGAVYVTDARARCLFKFNTEGRLLKSVRNELRSPYSVKIIQNQLYVADSNVVKVFDMDCNVVGTLQERNSDSHDIAVGPDALYVAGVKKIRVYTGCFIRDLNIQPTSLILSEFCGICFHSSGHIIATTCKTGIHVFKPSGECATSVGLVSSGVIKFPAGVAVDEDGFVYVCGFDSDNVVVF